MSNTDTPRENDKAPGRPEVTVAMWNHIESRTPRRRTSEPKPMCDAELHGIAEDGQYCGYNTNTDEADSSTPWNTYVCGKNYVAGANFFEQGPAPWDTLVRVLQCAAGHIEIKESDGG